MTVLKGLAITGIWLIMIWSLWLHVWLKQKNSTKVELQPQSEKKIGPQYCSNIQVNIALNAGQIFDAITKCKQSQRQAIRLNLFIITLINILNKVKKDKFLD